MLFCFCTTYTESDSEPALSAAGPVAKKKKPVRKVKKKKKMKERLANSKEASAASSGFLFFVCLNNIFLRIDHYCQLMFLCL